MTYDFTKSTDRLNWAIARYIERTGEKLINATLAKVADVSAATVSHWRSTGKDATGISAEKARRLEPFLQVDAVWLEKGEGFPDKKDSSYPLPALSSSVIPSNRATAELVAVMKTCRFESGKYIPPAEYNGPSAYVPRTIAETAPDAFAVIYRGEAMHPALEDGQALVLSAMWPMTPGKHCIVEFKNGWRMAIFAGDDATGCPQFRDKITTKGFSEDSVKVYAVLGFFDSADIRSSSAPK